MIRSRAPRIAALAVLTAICLPQKALADCGHAEVTVVGSLSETDFACRALHDVLEFFRELGLPFVPRVTITLKDAVSIDLSGHEPGQPPVLAPVSGRFDLGRRAIPRAPMAAAASHGASPGPPSWPSRSSSTSWRTWRAPRCSANAGTALLLHGANISPMPYSSS